MTVTVRPVAEAGEVSGLFHAYRAHYGHDGPVTATHAWLREQLAEGRLRIAVANVRRVVSARRSACEGAPHLVLAS